MFVCVWQGIFWTRHMYFRCLKCSLLPLCFLFLVTFFFSVCLCVRAGIIVPCGQGLSIFPLEQCQMRRRAAFIFPSPECHFFYTRTHFVSFFVLVKLFSFSLSIHELAEETSVAKGPSQRWLFFSARTDFVVNFPAKLLKWKLRRIVYSFDSPQGHELVRSKYFSLKTKYVLCAYDKNYANIGRRRYGHQMWLTTVIAVRA